MRNVRPGDHGCLLALPAMLLRSYGCRLRARTSSRLLVFPCCPYAQRVDRLYRSAVWLTDKDTGLRVHTLSCPDGTVLPNAVSAHYTWDPNTLAGTVQVTYNVPACGNPAGYLTTNFVQIRQAPDA